MSEERTNPTNEPPEPTIADVLQAIADLRSEVREALAHLADGSGSTLAQVHDMERRLDRAGRELLSVQRAAE